MLASPELNIKIKIKLLYSFWSKNNPEKIQYVGIRGMEERTLKYIQSQIPGADFDILYCDNLVVDNSKFGLNSWLGHKTKETSSDIHQHDWIVDGNDFICLFLFKHESKQMISNNSHMHGTTPYQNFGCKISKLNKLNRQNLK